MMPREAVEILSHLRASVDGERAAALDVALAALAERVERVREEADHFCEMLDHMFPAAEEGDRNAAWDELRHLFRLSPDVLGELERRFAEQ